MDPLTNYGYIKGVPSAYLLHCENYSCSRLSFHPVCAFLDLQVLGQNAVDRYDLIAAYKSSLHGRGVCVRLVDDHVAALRLVDDRTDASVCVRKHHLEVVVLLFGYIYGVWVKLLEHRVHTSPHDPVDRKRVNVRAVQLLYYAVVYFCPFAELEAL